MRVSSAFALIVLVLGCSLFGYALLPAEGTEDTCDAYHVDVTADRPVNQSSLEVSDYATLSLDQQRAFMLAQSAPNNSTLVHESIFPKDHGVKYKGETYFVTQTAVTLDEAECPDETGISTNGKLLAGAALLLVGGGLVIGRNYYHRL